MNRTSRQTFVACLTTLLLVPLAALHANDEPQKSLPLSGEVFLVEGRTAFVSGAYGMAAEELAARLAEHNPIDRLAALAKARVPLFAIHGDSDKVVPLEANSGEMRKRYEALSGKMQLIVPSGQGHNMWEGFFQCQELVDFVVAEVSRTNRATGQLPNGEPTNATEAGGQKAAATKNLEEEYQVLVAKLPPDQQAWERLLQENLGSFLGKRVAESIEAAVK